MSDLPTLYHPLRRRDFFWSDQLADAICYRVPASRPADAQSPEGEWYCPNPECVVRTVTIFCKLYGEALPRMSCPACGEPLRFQHWLKHETLVPYRGEEG
jgi:hypothetical protein